MTNRTVIRPINNGRKNSLLLLLLTLYFDMMKRRYQSYFIVSLFFGWFVIGVIRIKKNKMMLIIFNVNIIDVRAV